MGRAGVARVPGATLAPPAGGDGSGSAGLVVVGAPVLARPWAGSDRERGACLAVAGLHGRVRLQLVDGGISPQRAAVQARQAVAGVVPARRFPPVVGALLGTDVRDTVQ